MRSGRLRHRLLLQSQSGSTNEYGEVEPGWTDEATVWGAIEPLSMREFSAQDQTQNETTVRVILRYRSDIDESWRVLDTADSPMTVYTIHGIINENKRDRMLELRCSEGVQSR
jgi:SPP1 family predicted phage head-tail adaptor